MKWDVVSTPISHQAHRLLQLISSTTFDNTSKAFDILYQRPINVLLQINRDVLKEKLIANSVALLDLNQHDLVIWLVEAWYPERIPVSAITKGVLFWKSPEVAFTEFTDLQILEQAIDAELQKPQEH